MTKNYSGWRKKVKKESVYIKLYYSLICSNLCTYLCCCCYSQIFGHCCLKTSWGFCHNNYLESLNQTLYSIHWDSLFSFYCWSPEDILYQLIHHIICLFHWHQSIQLFLALPDTEIEFTISMFISARPYGLNKGFSLKFPESYCGRYLKKFREYNSQNITTTTTKMRTLVHQWIIWISLLGHIKFFAELLKIG